MLIHHSKSKTTSSSSESETTRRALSLCLTFKPSSIKKLRSLSNGFLRHFHLQFALKLKRLNVNLSKLEKAPPQLKLLTYWDNSKMPTTMRTIRKVNGENSSKITTWEEMDAIKNLITKINTQISDLLSKRNQVRAPNNPAIKIKMYWVNEVTTRLIVTWTSLYAAIATKTILVTPIAPSKKEMSTMPTLPSNNTISTEASNNRRCKSLILRHQFSPKNKHKSLRKKDWKGLDQLTR